MHDDEPQRLKKQQEAPPELVRALEALRKGTDENARLERVAAKLGALLDAPPPPPAAPGVVRGVTSALIRRAAFKVIIGGLAVLAPAAWMMRSGQSAKLQEQTRASEQVAVAKLPDAVVRDAGIAAAAQADSALYAAGARALAPEIVAESQKQDQTVEPVKAVRTRRHSARLRRGGRESGRVTDRSAAEGVALDSARERSAGAKQAETGLRGAGAKQADAHDRNSSSERADEVARRAEEAERSARAKQADETERSSSSKQAAVERSASRTEADEREPSARNPQQAEAQKPAPAQPTASGATASESALLFEARKAMATDASVALRVLEDHARRYPKGALVPEREVLAIEALRALGRTAEADARLQRFEAHYPGSLYLGRLRR